MRVSGMMCCVMMVVMLVVMSSLVRMVHSVIVSSVMGSVAVMADRTRPEGLCLPRRHSVLPDRKPHIEKHILVGNCRSVHTWSAMPPDMRQSVQSIKRMSKTSVRAP